MNRAFFGSALATLLFAGQAPAQPYPSRPVTFIVPYGAGGPVDTLARILSEPMRTSLGQPVIVENVTGASGTIGVARAVRAATDGYTVSIGNWSSHVFNGAIYTLPYDIRTCPSRRSMSVYWGKADSLRTPGFQYGCGLSS